MQYNPSDIHSFKRTPYVRWDRVLFSKTTFTHYSTIGLTNNVYSFSYSFLEALKFCTKPMLIGENVDQVRF